ncbi:MAG: hypothetical protein EBU97_03380, partial [Rhodobacteraceae bacterium]|nr:hypothetical protein [Paracoccaceae bacterium]
RGEAADLQSAISHLRRENAITARRAEAASRALHSPLVLDQITTPAPDPTPTELPQIDDQAAPFSSMRLTSLSHLSADGRVVMAAPNAAPRADGQTALALGTPASALSAPLDMGDLVRALNFPDGPDDRDGFRALRMALEHRAVAHLIRCAQEVLTQLAQEGIFMDDLRPDRPRPEVLRQFAMGARGRAVAALGGVRDRSSLALTKGRMREDPRFRSAGLEFLRQFDLVLTEFAPQMTDAHLAALADTRSLRAFMLFGRATGTFG